MAYPNRKAVFARQKPIAQYPEKKIRKVMKQKKKPKASPQFTGALEGSY